jgi:hypothetical protein
MYTQFFITFESLHYDTVISAACQWSTATCYGLNTRVSTRGTGPTLPPSKQVPGVLSPEAKWLKPITITHFPVVPGLRMRGAVTPRFDVVLI